MYPENQQDKLRTAITCVGNAEKTLEDYQCFLKTEKYKQWNEDQETKRQEAIKNMIGKGYFYTTLFCIFLKKINLFICIFKKKCYNLFR